MKYQRLITVVFIMLVFGLLIIFAFHSYVSEEERYYDVYVPAMDKTFQCLERSHNIHNFKCKMNNGDEITIRGTYIIKAIEK